MAVASDEPDKKTPALFFDRDGVVNLSPGPGYVLSWEAFHFAPGIPELVRLVKEAGWLAIVVTSQKGVGKGLLSAADLKDMHDRMQAFLRENAGTGFDAIYAYTGEPDCRHQPKPDPEMIFTGATEHGIDLSRSWMIGDADRDIEMGIAADLAGTVRIRGDKAMGVEATSTFDSVEESLSFFRDLLSVDSQS